jgi:excisionase family DNA binding protein
MPGLNETYVSSGEAANILGIHPLAIQKLIHQSRLPAEKIASRWLIPRSPLEEFARTYEGKPGRPRLKRKYTKRSSKWQNK